MVMSLFFLNHVEEFEIKKQLIKKSKQHTLAIKEAEIEILFQTHYVKTLWTPLHVNSVIESTMVYLFEA